jgi:hypothetical protein
VGVVGQLEPEEGLERRHIGAPVGRNGCKQPSGGNDPGIEFGHELVGRKSEILVHETSARPDDAATDHRRDPGQTEFMVRFDRGERHGQMAAEHRPESDKEQAEKNQHGEVLDGEEIQADQDRVAVDRHSPESAPERHARDDGHRHVQIVARRMHLFGRHREAPGSCRERLTPPA